MLLVDLSCIVGNSLGKFAKHDKGSDLFHRLIATILLAMPLICSPVKVSAQGWGPLDPGFGKGSGVCNISGTSYQCLAFRCDARGQVHLALIGNSGALASNQYAALSVDGGKAKLISFRQGDLPGMMVANQSVYSYGDLLLEMADGGEVTVNSTSQQSFSLTGAGQAIDRAFKSCVARGSIAGLEELAELVESEKARRAGSSNSIYVRHLPGTDTQGREIDSGLSNPALRGLDHEACIRRCLGDGRCQIASLNERTGLCSLKSGFGVLIPDANVVSTFVEARPDRVLRPQIAGGPPKLMSGLRWRPGEQTASYVARLRGAAATMGAPCTQDETTLRQFTKGITLTPPGNTGQTGQAMQISWTAKHLATRVPAWIVLSVDRPVRFSGDGFFALTPGALGPFGVSVGQGSQRAFVPFHNGQNIRQGSVGIIPLTAGDYTIRATLVGYLRNCQQELPLMQATWQVKVAPDAPRIVLRDITAPDPFPHIIDIPEFARRIKLNETRFTLLNAGDGSEIIAREGKKLRLSPTRRFVTLYDDGFYEILDVLDGKSLLRLKGMTLAWWNSDSFVLSDFAPWGEISMASTLRPATLVSQFQTGSSCCLNNGNSQLSVSLENGTVQVSERFWSLTDGEFLGVLDSPEYAPRSSGDLGGSHFPSVFSALGFVAPLDSDARWDTPLGPVYSYGLDYVDDHGSDSAESRNIINMALPPVPLRPNPEFGQPIVLAAEKSSGTVLRGIGAGTPGQGNTGFQAALGRWGVELSDAVLPQERIAAQPHAQRRKLGDDLIARQQAFLRANIEADLARRGKYAKWSIYNPQDSATPGVTYCNYSPMMDDLNGGKDVSNIGEVLLSAADFDLAHRYETNGYTIWVTRSICNGGATGGTLTEASSLNIYDSRLPARNFATYRVDSNYVLRSSFTRVFFNVGFKSKLIQDRYLLTYAPGEGALSVFDLKAREYRFRNDYVRRGDLLKDAFLDQELRHLFQINTDGSFTIYRLSDQAPVLEGRYLDDELVVWTADFYFDATEEGAAFVELRFPGKPGQFSMQQFDTTLRVPGLMRAVLDGGGTPGKRDIGIPPELNGQLISLNDAIKGYVQVAGPRPVKFVRLYQDGLLTDTYETTRGGTIAVNATRKNAARWATLVAEDRDGLVSLPLTVDLGPVPNQLPRTHFLGIGIDYYQDPDLGSLNYAKLDAVALSETFATLDGKSIDLQSNFLLTDRRASRAGIEGKLNEILAAASPGDHIVVFFAGHGLQDSNGDLYLGMSKTDLSDVGATSLEWSRIVSALRGADVRITVLLDACHSGAAGTSAFATNDSVVEGLRATAPAALTILSASKGRQFSGESSIIGGGYFTNALVRVLTSQRATFDENNNGILEAVELYRGVKTLVVSNRGELQTPWLSRNQLVGEYGLF